MRDRTRESVQGGQPGAFPVHPYAYLFPHATAVDNHGGNAGESRVLAEKGLEFPVKVGDVLLIRDVRFRLVEPYPRGRSNPSLALLTDG